MPDGIHISGPARRLVENVSVAGRPPRGRPSRQAGTKTVEDEIDKLARQDGAGAIQSVLSHLDTIAGQLPPGPVEVVRRLLAGVLGSFSGSKPTSERLAARLSGEPYDEHRLSMFRSLAELLGDTAPEPRPALGSAERWAWEPFFEAYFSNFIEGTEFGVNEAREIAIDGVIPAERPADAHDVAATYQSCPTRPPVHSRQSAPTNSWTSSAICTACSWWRDPRSDQASSRSGATTPEATRCGA